MMNEEMVVYCYTNIVNGKKYVGITKNQLSKRHSQHIADTNLNRDNSPFHNAIKKYGIDNFTLEILKKCETIEDLKESEIFYINKLNTFVHSENSNGYNATLGGDGVFGISGENHPLFGKKASEETRKKLSEIRRNNYDNSKLRELNDDSCGENNPFFGCHHSDETKKIISEKRKGENNHNYNKGREIYCVELKTVFRSLHHANIETGISKGSISECCKGERKTAGKMHWYYYDEYLNMITLSQANES